MPWKIIRSGMYMHIFVFVFIEELVKSFGCAALHLW